MGEYFVLVRVIGNPVAAEILEAETVGLRGIPEDLGGIVATIITLANCVIQNPEK